MKTLDELKVVLSEPPSEKKELLNTRPDGSRPARLPNVKRVNDYSDDYLMKQLDKHYDFHHIAAKVGHPDGKWLMAQEVAVEVFGGEASDYSRSFLIRIGKIMKYLEDSKKIRFRRVLDGRCRYYLHAPQ